MNLGLELFTAIASSMADLDETIKEIARRRASSGRKGVKSGKWQLAINRNRKRNKAARVSRRKNRN